MSFTCWSISHFLDQLGQLEIRSIKLTALSFIFIFPFFVFPSPVSSAEACPAGNSIYEYRCLDDQDLSRDCLDRTLSGCPKPEGGTGSWCCRYLRPTSSPAPACSHPNFCIPTAEIEIGGCGTDYTLDSTLSCLPHDSQPRTCCRYTGPTPTPAPGGSPWGATPIPPGSPGSRGFIPLKTPCNQVEDEEFHSLRPYPASPCDPLIPAPNYQTFSCGKSLNVTGQFKFDPYVDLASLTPFDPATAIPGTLYRCTDDPTRVCTIKRSAFDISLDLSQAKIPILGNTQDALDDATKVNHYLQWYLAGTNPWWSDGQLQPPPSSSADYSCIGRSVADYTNQIIAGKQSRNLNNILLLSPAFNIGAPSFSAIWNAFKPKVNLNDLAGIAANTYNTSPTDTITKYVNAVRSNFAGQQIFLTEIGMIEKDFVGTAHNQAKINLAAEIANLKADKQISSALLFNSINIEPNPQFQYNIMEQEEISAVCGDSCGKIGVNSAKYYYKPGSFYDQAKNLGMRHVLEITNGDLRALLEGLKRSFSLNLTPIIRVGVGSSGLSADAYLNLLQQADQLAAAQNKTVYALAGPNEPDAEHWASPGCAGAPSAVQNPSVDRFLTFAGPLKKLLPQSLQKAIRQAMADGPIGYSFHNYYIDPPRRLSSVNTWEKIFSQIPLSTLEDTAGEVTIGLIPSQQPGNSPGDLALVDNPNYFEGGQVYPNTSGPNAITLTIKPVSDSNTDSRLFFPHVRQLDLLTRLLAALHRPSPYNPAAEQNVANNLAPDTRFKRGDYLTGRNTLNTEVRASQSAPPPLIDYPGYDQRCDLTEVRFNPGDDLAGSRVTARLAYTQKFSYKPIDTASVPGCVAKDTCSGDPGCDTCDKGGWNSAWGSPPPPVCANLKCSWRDGTNPTYCADPKTDPTKKCGTYIEGPTDIKLPTEARVGVFVKSPLLDSIYDTLVTASDSVFNRFFAQKKSIWDDPRPGGRDIPGGSAIGYGATAVTDPTHQDIPDSAGYSAGKGGGGAEIYFKHLGSLFDYFLGGSQDPKNLQRLLRPKDLTSAAGPGNIIPPTPTPDASSLERSLACIPPSLKNADGAYTTTFIANTDDAPSSSAITDLIAYIEEQKTTNSTYWANSKFKDRYAKVRDYCSSRGFNPSFCLALYLEESHAESVGTYPLGCDAATSLDSSLTCLTTTEPSVYKTRPLDEFLCRYSDGHYPCDFRDHPNFVCNLFYWYGRLK